MNDSLVDRIIKVGLVAGLILGCIVCFLTVFPAAMGRTSKGLTPFFFEDRWISRGELAFATLPVTPYEVAPGHPTWENVRAEYYFSSGSSTGYELHTRFMLPNQSDAGLLLASMTMITDYGSVTYASPSWGSEIYSVEPEVCDSVDIAWANDKEQCTCSIGGGACLTWWTDEGVYVIVSKSMYTETLEEFANSLTPITN